MHEGFLRWRRYRWMKVGVLLCVAAGVAYAVDQPIGRPNGGTWLGYTLGITGAALILWLMAFGLRKRTYRSSGPPLQAWLSAHVWLGLALVVIATLHTGFQLGWNIHGLAWLLTLLTVASGALGVIAYRRLPVRLSLNRKEMTVEAMLQVIAGLDRDARVAARPLGTDINAAVLDAAERTVVGGSVWRQLSGYDPKCATSAALRTVRAAAAGLPPEQSLAAQEVIAVLARKRSALAQLRRDVQLRALLHGWLLLHLPLSFALLAALLAHVIAVLGLR